MKTLVLANQKGGVGKTAVATLLAHYLAARGFRTLVIDLDHQANLTRPLRVSGKPVVSASTADKVLTDAGTSVEDAPFVLMPSSQALLALERAREFHNTFATNLRDFLRAMDDRFDFCIIDTNPNPDIRVVAALVSADFALSPIQLNQESIEGIRALLTHERVGVERIRQTLNPKLRFLGIVPTLVEPTPFQRKNLLKLVEVSALRQMLLSLVDEPQSGADYALIPKRSVIAEAQAAGVFLADIKGQTAARDTWREVLPVIARIAHLMGDR